MELEAVVCYGCAGLHKVVFCVIARLSRSFSAVKEPVQGLGTGSVAYLREFLEPQRRGTSRSQQRSSSPSTCQDNVQISISSTSPGNKQVIMCIIILITIDLSYGYFDIPSIALVAFPDYCSWKE
ncbi:hypothetical protein CLAIMM_00179 [Cladophialophora immunda]|nr:hypothetical protein CLAIMM_00179 [Cladophialophora immunda]